MAPGAHRVAPGTPVPLQDCPQNARGLCSISCPGDALLAGSHTQPAARGPPGPRCWMPEKVRAHSTDGFSITSRNHEQKVYAPESAETR